MILKSEKVVRYIATLGPFGYFTAPGTFGSAIGLLVSVFLINKFFTNSISHFIVILIFAFLSFLIIKQYCKQTTSCDPQEIILDEFVGCIVALYIVPLHINTLLIGFLVFRFLDITKLFGISYIEKSFNGSYAILFDDIAAGLITNFILKLLLYLWAS
jgi:phosphatidylglycerophosphatase A